MRIRSLLVPLAAALVLACDRGGPGPEELDTSGLPEGVSVDEDLGSLTVQNRVDEPVAVFLDGQELYAVPPGRAYTFKNLPVREVDVYGVGRVSQKHFSLPKLTIEEGGEYEWTIEP